MTKFFKILLLALSVLGGVIQGSAEEIVLYPTIEWHYRTNNATNPTGWNSGYPKEITSNGTLECSSSAQIFLLQQFDFSNVDFSKIKSLKLSYTRGGNQSGTELGAWIFGSNDWGKDKNAWDNTNNTWKNNISNALGVNIGSAGTVNVPIFYSNRGNTTAYTQEFSREQIQQLQSGLSNGKLNLLVTSVYKEDEEHYYVSSKKIDNIEKNLRTDIYNYKSENKAKIEIEYYDYNHPNYELGLRPKQGDYTGWDAFKVGKDNVNLEIRTGSRLVAIEQLVIKDLQKNKKYSLVLSKDNQTGDLKAFNFPYSLPASSSVSNEEFKSQLQDVAGIDYTGASVAVEFKPGIGDFKCENNKWTITFLGSDVTAVSTDEYGNSIVNLLLCTKDNPTSSSGSQAHIATMGNADESKRPVVAEMKCSVINRNQNIGYASLKEAVDAAVSGDVLEVVNDVELTECVSTNGRELTVKGSELEPKHKIVRNNAYKGMMFLATNEEGTSLTLKNIIIDGNNVENLTANVLEENKSVVLEDVSFVNHKLAESQCLIKVGGTELELKGTTTISNVVGGCTFNLNRGNYFTDNTSYTDGANAVVPSITVAEDFGDAQVVVGDIDTSSKYNFVLEGKGLFLEEGKLIIKVAKARIGETAYNSFSDALTNVQNGEIITLCNDEEINARINLPTYSITIDGMSQYSIKRNEDYSTGMMILNSNQTDANAVITLKNLIIDGNNVETQNQAIEINKKVILENVILKNHKLPNSTGIVKVIAGSTPTIKGDITLENNKGCTFFLNRNASIHDNNATYNTAPSIGLYNDYRTNYFVVYQDVEGIQLSRDKYTIVNVGWEIVNGQGNNANHLRVLMNGYKLNISDAGAATLVLPFDAIIPGTVSVYTLDYSDDKVVATPVIEELSRNTPVYVKAGRGEYDFVIKEGGANGNIDSPQFGVLYGTYSRKVVGTNDYFLSWTNSDPETTGFYKVTGSNGEKYVSPFRAYMHIDPSIMPNARETIIIDFGETTGIDNVDSLKDSKSAKSLENGRIVILKGGRRYNTAGQVIK